MYQYLSGTQFIGMTNNKTTISFTQNTGKFGLSSLHLCLNSLIVYGPALGTHSQPGACAHQQQSRTTRLHLGLTVRVGNPEAQLQPAQTVLPIGML